MTHAPPDARLVAELRAAADRLIAGTPLRSGGKLTISDLVAEAGIKRWILTHKHPELNRLYQAEFANLGQVSASTREALDKLTDLEGDLKRLREENKNLKARVGIYAGLIRDLTQQLATAMDERDSVQARLEDLQDIPRLENLRQPR